MPRQARGESSPKTGRNGRSRRTAAGDTGRDLLWALLLTLLAWLHRIFFIVSNSDRALPLTEFYYGDSKAFFLYARALLAGQPYDNGIPFHPPGFAYFLAGVHGLLGAADPSAAVPHLYVKIVLALVSSLSVGLIFLLALPYLGRTVALLTAGLCIYHFGLYVLAAAPVTEGLYLTLLLTCLLVWSRKLEHSLAAPSESPREKKALWGAVLGVLLGLLALVRAESQLIAVVLVGIGLLGWLSGSRGPAGAVRSDSLRRGLPWILAVIGFAATLTPWTLRNYRSLAEVNLRFAAGMSEPLPTFVPLTLYGPLNLALANHGEADGTFSRDLMTSHQASGQLSVTDSQHLEFLLHGDRMAWEFIRGEPDAFGRLVLKKWKLYFGSTRLGWSQWDFPGGLSGVRRPIDVFVPYSSGAMSWILPAALLGALFCLWRPGPTRRWGLLVAVLTGSSLLVVALFFGYARQGLLMMPFWLSLAAFALVRLASAVTTRFGRGPIVDEPSRRLLTVLGCLALILLLLEAWGSTLDRKYHWTGTQLPGKRTLNPELTVYIRPLPSGS